MLFLVGADLPRPNTIRVKENLSLFLYFCFDLVLSQYSRIAGFGRREIELIQALCIYNIYIEYYSVGKTLKINLFNKISIVIL